MRALYIVSTLFMLLTSSTFAQQPPEIGASESEGGLYSKSYSDCMAKSEGVTVNMLDCSADELRRQDAALNAAYRKLMASLPPLQQEQLREAQRAWIRSRDGSCLLLQSREGGGTLAAVMGSDCVLEETTRRAKWLDALLDLQ
jgi:uncharacterized protein YecT (DUF1311 family)